MYIRIFDRQKFADQFDTYRHPIKASTMAIIVAVYILLFTYLIIRYGGYVGFIPTSLTMFGILSCVLLTRLGMKKVAVTLLYLGITGTLLTLLTSSLLYFIVSLTAQLGLTLIIVNLFGLGKVRIMVGVMITMIVYGLWYHADAIMANPQQNITFALYTLPTIFTTMSAAIYSQYRIQSGIRLLEVANEDLAAESQKRENIIRALPGSVIITSTDPIPQILWCNEATTHILKHTQKALRGQSINTFFVNTDTLQNALAQLTTHGFIRDLSLRMKDCEGKSYPTISNVHIIEFEGNPAILWMLEDMTALKKAERIIEQSKRMDNIGVMAGKVTHDFNNLLSVVNISMDMGAAKLESDHPSRKHFVQASSTVMEAADLVQQLRGYAQLGQIVLDSVDTTRFLEGVVDKIAVSTPQNIDFQPRIPPSLPPIDIDSKKIERVLLNFIFNAFDAIDGQDGEVTLSAEEIYVAPHEVASLTNYAGNQLDPTTYLCISVSDTGRGIAPETLENMFEPFFTTKEKGSGLGLAATQGIVQNHDGGILVDSELGQGTTFRLLLPLANLPIADLAYNQPFIHSS